MSNTAGVTLLTNGAATSAAQSWPGGRGRFEAAATFGAGSVALESLMPDGATWAAVKDVNGAVVSLTAAGGQVFELPPCPIRASVVTATAVYAAANRIPS